jgi:hypothetical protein
MATVSKKNKEGNHRGLALQNGKPDCEEFAPFALVCLKVFGACANFPRTQDSGTQMFTRAKTPRTQSSESVFLASFAPLREKIRIWLRHCRAKFFAIKFLFPYYEGATALADVTATNSPLAPIGARKKGHQMSHLIGAQLSPG